MAAPRESWLRSKDDLKWVEAMLCCRSSDGLCGETGYCLYGECFSELRQLDIAQKSLSEAARHLREAFKSLAVITKEDKARLLAEHGDELEVLRLNLSELLKNKSA